MASSVAGKMSVIEFERYKAFFPAIEQGNTTNFFRPWTDPESDGLSEENRAMEAPGIGDRQDGESIHRIGQDSSEPGLGGILPANRQSSKDLSSPTTGRRRHRRKSYRPHRSAASNDPSFRGVTVSVQTCLSRQKRSKRWQSQLLIKSYFTVRGRGFPRTFRTRKASCGDSFGDTSSDSDGGRDSPSQRCPDLSAQRNKMYLRYQRPLRMIGYSGKQCASCGVRRTPLWRDAEDGTPLCNACGIRYKKYRVHCGGCWLIPRKDGKTFTHCTRCGEEFRLAVFRRATKH